MQNHTSDEHTPTLNTVASSRSELTSDVVLSDSYLHPWTQTQLQCSLLAGFNQGFNCACTLLFDL